MLPEVFFGGARGGGKTDGVLGKWALKERRYGQHFNARMFRRTTTSSDDAIERAKEIYEPLGAKFNASKLTFRMPHGGRVSFGYLDSVSDADAQQGKNLTDAWIEEAGQHASPAAIDKLFGALRSSHGVPVQMILTANPGGSGQGWIRDRYKLVPFPMGPKIVDRVLPDGSVHRMGVIPSRLTDNRILLDRDPGYQSRLHLVGSAQLVQAWMNGDWSAIEGAFFAEWDETRHVVAPFAVPSDWLRFRSMDWGSAKPFSVGWWAVVGDDHRLPDGRVLPRGAMVRYREWYGCQPGQPNTGLKLTAEEVAQGIAIREAGDKITYGTLDPAAFAEDGGPSIAERMQAWKSADGKLRGPSFNPADNARVGRSGAMGGWDLMRARMRGEDGVPMLYVFSTCRDFIRTVPMLQHDVSRPEDLDTTAEDHVADECFVAGTLVETADGPRPIETLSEGVVLSTDDRYVPFVGARKTRKKARVIRLTFGDGTEVTCTPNHKFLVDRDEWCYASDLLLRSVLCSQPWSARQFKSSTVSGSTDVVGISRSAGAGFIVKFGKRLTAAFRAATISITSMVTRPTTLWATWNASRAGSTWAGDMVTLLPSAARQALTALTLRRLFGTELTPVGHGTQTITSACCGPSWSDAWSFDAKSAAKRSAAVLFRPRTQNSAVLRARRVLCVSVEELPEPADVYCLTVPSTSAFALAGGMIVHNCRYACTSRPWVASVRKHDGPGDRYDHNRRKLRTQQTRGSAWAQ